MKSLEVTKITLLRTETGNASSGVLVVQSPTAVVMLHSA